MCKPPPGEKTNLSPHLPAINERKTKSHDHLSAPPVPRPAAPPRKTPWAASTPAAAASSSATGAVAPVAVGVWISVTEGDWGEPR